MLIAGRVVADSLLGVHSFNHECNICSAARLCLFSRVNALGEPLPTKASSLKRPARLRQDSSSRDDPNSALPDRKIVVEPLEWWVMGYLRNVAVGVARGILYKKSHRATKFI